MSTDFEAMNTYYNAQQQADCDFIVRMGKSVWHLQQELALQKQHLSACQIKIRQYEAMTGVSSAKLPHESKIPDWEYMLRNTAKPKGVQFNVKD
ncbi:MAG: hypothetical protein KGL39_39930 [Patescibacteria group bacterium]|nr:hypothetical protein [Patescibacteria group bacterium]